MIHRNLSGVFSLLVGLSIGGISYAKEIPLQLSEVEDLFIGNTLTMVYNGRTTLQFTAENGDITQEMASGGSKTGSWEISGSRNPRICYDFPTDNKIKCFVVRRDDVNDTFVIYSYRNKRAAKVVFRVTDVERGNNLVNAYTPPPETVFLNRKMVRQVQAALNKRGFRAGAVDGIMGNQTRGAIAEFQRFISQTETGDLTQDQLDRLLN